MSVDPPVRRAFSDEHGPGAFHSLGILLRRSRNISPPKSPVFRIAYDEDYDHSSTPPFSSPQAPRGVRPPSSPSPHRSPPSSSSTHRPFPPCPQLSRGMSAPIMLSNGKPLKSSLKPSSPSPAMLVPPHKHHRARSEPPTPTTPKNVHFPEKDYGLATVCLFNRLARPASLGNPTNSNSDDTETEGEDAPSARFPCPRFLPVFDYEIDPTKSSPVPCKSSLPANLFLESLSTPSSSNTKPSLAGSILVRNLAFEKHVAVRFTLDHWQTVNEVHTHYVGSLSLPLLFSPLPSPEEARTRGWDRFAFMIRLEDYAPSLSTRTLWLAVRYGINSTYPEPSSSEYGPGGEWWDNNCGKNYRVRFRPAIPAPNQTKPRWETFPAPITSPPIRLRTTCKEHALGLMFQSAPNMEDRLSAPLRAGKLHLTNYAPPTVRAIPSISYPSAGLAQISSPSSRTDMVSPSLATLRSSSDKESTSPASSALSTPTVSPTIVRVIIGGQPATCTHESGEKSDEEIATYSKLGHTADWDWSAPIKPWSEAPSHQHDDHVPGSELPERQRELPSPSGKSAISESSSLYDAFITQWCFAQGPSSNHHAYDNGGITA